jgi:hypothetical protein
VEVRIRLDEVKFADEKMATSAVAAGSAVSASPAASASSAAPAAAQ